ncbi:type II secretion system protein [Campylobacter sp. US33a]|uniref:Type II secretion system protein n=1 Tax=Campylobacter sp. CCS1377 TaxID=3158229 RepID=A0AAU7E690_9BACT|nr:type II secretion system protein [Campylobacter sp. US33a]MCW1360683.1 type II secretion system GspH family protein [Campylobacter jejuni]TEY04068.1 prepilin-type N-terminal cleavage/methylation domain-containing protein [Campylobacter sp. US33a]
MGFRKAFSILELIFVIAIIAILVSISIPYFSNSKQEAKITKLKADFTTLQSALVFYKNQNFLRSNSQNLSVLDEAKIGLEKEPLFFCTQSQISVCNDGANCCQGSLLSNAIYSNKQAWMKTGFNAYRYYITPKFFFDFIYDFESGELKCIGQRCKELL